jgi:hypothetical protein
MSQEPDEENSLSPQESLRLISSQQQRARQVFFGDALMYWGPWGFAWLIGFGLFFLHQGLHGEPYVNMPGNLPLIVLFCLMAAAMVISAIAGVKAGRLIQGPSNVQGMMYGFSWFFGFISVVALGIRFAAGLPDDEQAVLWSGMAVGMTGALYLAGAAMWQDWSMFVMGLWLTAINAVGITLGPGWHPLLVSVAGGGGLLIVGLVLRMRGQRVPT